MVQPAPVPASARIETLDVLRGFALLGILAMNIRAMAAPFGAYMYPYAMFDYTGVNRAAFIFTSTVVDLKMMGLFSMLFGAGVLLYAAKPTEDGRPPRGLWFRRMFWLLVIGLVHAYLIWDGDILVPYALCGILLLWWVRRLPAWALVAGAVGLLAIGAVLTVRHGVAWDLMPEAQRAQEAEMLTPTRAQAEAAARPHARKLCRGRRGPGDVRLHGADVLLPVLLLLALRRHDAPGDGPLQVGLPRRPPSGARLCDRGRDLHPRRPGARMVRDGRARARWLRACRSARSPICGTTPARFSRRSATRRRSILVVKRGALAGLRRSLAAVGQMAFSNYLFHSVITSVIFLGWGFGLAGRFDYAEQLLIVPAIWAFQLVIEPYLAPALSLRPGRMAVAIPDLLAAAADAT